MAQTSSADNSFPLFARNRKKILRKRRARLCALINHVLGSFFKIGSAPDCGTRSISAGTASIFDDHLSVSRQREPILGAAVFLLFAYKWRYPGAKNYVGAVMKCERRFIISFEFVWRLSPIQFPNICALLILILCVRRACIAGFLPTFIIYFAVYSKLCQLVRSK